MFKIHKEELEVNGKKLTLETGKIARQADGAIIATLGLTKSVNKRKKLLTYLKKKNVESYQKVIKQLNLRK